jgi:hypothetical protein
MNQLPEQKVNRKATTNRKGKKTRLQRGNNKNDRRSKKNKTTEEEIKYKDEDRNRPHIKGEEK